VIRRPSCRLMAALAFGALAPMAAGAETWCLPYDTSASILQSADPSDIQVDWQDGRTIGLAWSILPLARFEEDGLSYIEGDLYGPSGGLANGLVVVLSDEWECAEY